MRNPFLTYFETKSGEILYRVGSGDENGRFRSVLVYIPCGPCDDAGTRVKEGRRYKKFVFSGHIGEKAPLEINKEWIARSEKRDEGYLLVPESDIAHVFSPYEALEKHMENEHVNRLVSTLEDAGIPRNRIGLYGGMLAGLRNENHGRGYKDIDVVINGLSNLDIVKALGRKYGGRSDHTRDIPRKRRDYYLCLWMDEHTKCDIKFSRDENDPFSFPKDFDVSGVSPRYFYGTVVDDSEAPTIPASWRVKLVDGRIVTVSTYLFWYIGAAWKGDDVLIYGKMADKENTDEENIVLCNLYHHMRVVTAA